jgi:hypothetical protein
MTRGPTVLPGSWLLIALVPLVTGAALLVHILVDVALPLGVAAAFAGALGLATVTWRRLATDMRAALRRRALVGIAIGLVATLAYDLTRLALVWTVGFQFNPFETIRVFGQLLVGVEQPQGIVFAAGALYHFANGIGFATALVLFVRRPRVRHGLAWAAMLELIMVSLYPGWLNLAAVDELVSVSLVGHAAYGLTMGLLARRLVGPDALSDGGGVRRAAAVVA